MCCTTSLGDNSCSAELTLQACPIVELHSETDGQHVCDYICPKSRQKCLFLIFIITFALSHPP